MPSPARAAPDRNAAELAADIRADLGEGPVWDDQNEQLVWVDMIAGRLHYYSPGSRSDHAVQLGRTLGSVVLDGHGGLVIAAQGGLFRLGQQAKLELLLPLEASPGSFLNDSCCDPAGNLWVGTTTEAEVPGAGALYRVSPDLSVTRMLGDLTIPNGLDWSPDGTTMYFADSPTGRVEAFPFDPVTSRLGKPVAFACFAPGEGVPDGLAVDAEGGVWVALWGGWSVRRFTSGGQLDLVVDVPVEHVTSCAFGGLALADLYITTASGAAHDSQAPAGGLFHFRAGQAGRPVRRFQVRRA
jgi:sugar lactone lactonase YvrE